MMRWAGEARHGRAALALVALPVASIVHADASPQTSSPTLHDRHRLWNLVHRSCATAASRDDYPPSP
jgi:hypothetical protein